MVVTSQDEVNGAGYLHFVQRGWEALHRTLGIAMGAIEAAREKGIIGLRDEL